MSRVSVIPFVRFYLNRFDHQLHFFPLLTRYPFFVQNFAQLLTLRPLFPRSRPKLFPPLPTHNLVDSLTSRSRSCS